MRSWCLEAHSPTQHSTTGRVSHAPPAHLRTTPLLAPPAPCPPVPVGVGGGSRLEPPVVEPEGLPLLLGPGPGPDTSLASASTWGHT